MVCLEKLVGEVLGHEGKHQIGSLRVWPKLLSFKKPLSQHFGIRKNRFTCRERNMSRNISSGRSPVCRCGGPTFSSHRQRAVFGYRREETGVVGDVVVGLPVEVSVFGIVGRRAWNKVAPDFGRR